MGVSKRRWSIPLKKEWPKKTIEFVDQVVGIPVVDSAGKLISLFSPSYEEEVETAYTARMNAALENARQTCRLHNQRIANAKKHEHTTKSPVATNHSKDLPRSVPVETRSTG